MAEGQLGFVEAGGGVTQDASRSVRRLAWASIDMVFLSQQEFEGAAVGVLERFKVGDEDVFVDLVDAGVGRTELDHLPGTRSRVTAVGGATGGRQFGPQADGGEHGCDERLRQGAGRRQERGGRRSSIRPIEAVFINFAGLRLT